MAGLSILAAVGCARRDAVQLTSHQKRLVAQGLSQAQLDALLKGMDAPTRKLALRHDPYRRQTDFWDRPAGWERIDIGAVPDLGFAGATGETAQVINALKPAAPLPIRPMRPFVLKAGGPDRDRALQCLTQAVYYEAAREPEKGQEAVAQVVLNRVRHPAYPKSVCGVVYQGSLRATGCQFTFTCDGSLAAPPEPTLWARAAAVARRALAGYVDKDVGPATHYHATYVAPYWAPTLVKLTQVGAHIFYRWTGPWGEPPAFTARYAGHEADLSPQLLASVDPRIQGGLLAPHAAPSPATRKVTLSVGGEARTYTVAEPGAAAGPAPGTVGLQPTRRKPTVDEIKRINESLAAMEKSMDGPPAAPASGAAGAGQVNTGQAGAGQGGPTAAAAPTP